MVGKEAGIFAPPTETGFRPPVSIRNSEVVIFPEVRLTRRQKQMLTLTVQGLSIKDIAEELSLHIGSISIHRRHIKDAFGTDSMFQSIIKAANMGILDVSELTKGMDKEALEKLSKRELEVLESFSNSNNPKETARSLHIRPSTLHKDCDSIRKKLGLEKNPQRGLAYLPSILLYMGAKKENVLPPKEFTDLSGKQKVVLKLTLSGYSAKQISEKLNHTTNCIYARHHKIFESFGVSTFTELLIKLVDKKFLDPRQYIEDVKKADSNFLKNVDSADISSLLSVISSDEWVFLNAFVTGNKKGTTNKEIADVLNVSTVTIHGSILSISKKLGGAKREHIAMWYLAATNAEGE